MTLARKLLMGANPGGGGSGYSFNMTAGDSGLGYFGYDTGVLVGTFGSIDASPIPANPLNYFLSGSGAGDAYIGFAGDILTQLTGKTVWVNGVSYPFDSFDWNYSPGQNETAAEWASARPSIPSTGPYFCEIK